MVSVAVLLNRAEMVAVVGLAELVSDLVDGLCYNLARVVAARISEMDHFIARCSFCIFILAVYAFLFIV